MKKFLSLALAVVTALGVTAGAATLQSTQDNENKQAPVERKIDKKNNRKAKKDKVGKEQKAINLFDGIQLTDQQKQALKELRAQKPEKPVKEAPCCKGDTAACCKGEGQPCCYQVSPEQKAQQARQRLEKIKTILTPEQYQQYLENAAVAQMTKGNKGQANPRKGQGKDGRKLGKADKGQRGAKPAPEAKNK